jgi:uncharacterized protein (TIGR02145 family)
MSSKDYIYCYQGSALRVAGDTAVIGSVYVDPLRPVTIGGQIWSSNNLAIDDGQGGIYTKTVNYGQGDVIEYYYTWQAALRVAATVQGWHLPTAAEWDTLANAVGSAVAGTKLKSAYGWESGNGTDDYGFAAFPAGGFGEDGFDGLGTSSRFWTATESSGYWLADFRFFMSSSATMLSNSHFQSDGNSVRLVKDA